MSEMKLGMVESRFADIIWQNEPLSTHKLVELCEEKLKWKRTTTYTVLKRLSERGMFQNNGGVVTSIVSRNDFYSMQSEKFIDETFNGSLPAFLTAFTARKSLTEEEIAHLKRIVAEHEEE
ncbi:MAG: BlaI/MecI/CopY family transcriptional regulator [Oscillospiraceae bacterium]|nr:BlaI/MecI/CopY family transcriptional regulator [Oscillospiraceae bacterium]MBQ3049579.1 BlaI/MecI/CopY family transcriptional regulator [Oscillospiraceae bacterium]MBQ9938715.1 BlaI/MecI/CopY family transcriptional regulator [Oscillospiraceae bacterium]